MKVWHWHVEQVDGLHVIILRNLATKHGLHKGTRMIIIRTSYMVLQACMHLGPHVRKHLFIPLILLMSSLDELSFQFTHQFWCGWHLL